MFRKEETAKEVHVKRDDESQKRICPDRSDSDDNGHRTGVDDDFGTE